MLTDFSTDEGPKEENLYLENRGAALRGLPPLILKVGKMIRFFLWRAQRVGGVESAVALAKEHLPSFHLHGDLE